MTESDSMILDGIDNGLSLVERARLAIVTVVVEPAKKFIILGPVLVFKLATVIHPQFDMQLVSLHHHSIECLPVSLSVKVNI